MSALVEGYSLESEIAECCQAIYRATDPDEALTIWGRLRELIGEKNERERLQYLSESKAVNAGAVTQTYR